MKFEESQTFPVYKRRPTVTITSDDTGESTVPASVTFTPVNWDTPQTVTLTGINDTIVDTDTQTTVTISVTGSGTVLVAVDNFSVTRFGTLWALEGFEGVWGELWCRGVL